LRLLLDTHALLWVLSANPKLSSRARAAVLDDGNEILVSSVCAFEITTKYRLGKLPEFAEVAKDFPALLADLRHSPLPITLDHAALAGRLEIDHADPFDRLLIAQSILDRLTLVSNEKLFDSFGVQRLW
jgi:PIN domain nuclease of toxin-antitoxin system